jgi:hypothetical protein
MDFLINRLPMLDQIQKYRNGNNQQIKLMVRLHVLRSCLRYLKAVIQPRKKELYKNFISSLIRNFRALVLVNLAAAEKKHCLDT